MTVKIHHTSATASNHFGNAPVGLLTKRHERVNCGHCKGNRKKAKRA